MLDKLKIKITGMSAFYNNDEYDVLKFDIQCKQLIKMNKEICNNFKYSNDYQRYIPHLTIAYVKKGNADKYIKNVKLVYVEPDEYVYNFNKRDIKLIPLKLK